MQFVAVCCRMCNVACCSLFEAGVTDFEYSCVMGLKCVAVCCSVLQCVAVCVTWRATVLQCVAMAGLCWIQLSHGMRRVAVCCSVLQFVAVCCSVCNKAY